jgi:pimeloyl-ACP methyl ester carboxylesterase
MKKQILSALWALLLSACGAELAAESGPPPEGNAGAAVEGARASGSEVLRLRHQVLNDSQVPGYEGQTFQLAVYERIRADLEADPGWNAEGRVVLFIHGAGYAGEPIFDLDVEGYSFMAHLAEQGFDTYTLDLSGYGRSTRPAQMGVPCNASNALKATLGISCPAEHAATLTTSGSDLDDIDAVVDFIRQRQGVQRVHVVGGSQGGWRAIFYAASYPQKVARLVVQGSGGSGLLGRDTPPATVPAPGEAYSGQDREGFLDRSLSPACRPDQFAPGVLEAAWDQTLATDSTGATWSKPVVRWPRQTMWGTGRLTLQAVAAPTLVVSGACDPLVSDASARALYDNLTPTNKVRAYLAGSGHALMWETGAPLLFSVTADWLEDGNVGGRTSGTVNVSLDGTRTWR